MVRKIPLEPGNLQDFKQFLINWNIQYPYDRYWRRKYSVSFGSPEHRAMRFEDMVMDLMEDKIMRKLEEEHFAESLADFHNSLLPGESEESLMLSGKQVVKMSQSEIDKDFNELDISQFND